MAWGSGEYERQLRRLQDDTFDGGALMALEWVADQIGDPLPPALMRLVDDGNRAALISQLRSEWKARIPREASGRS